MGGTYLVQKGEQEMHTKFQWGKINFEDREGGGRNMLK
jgi:hypothetical protein